MDEVRFRRSERALWDALVSTVGHNRSLRPTRLCCSISGIEGDRHELRCVDVHSSHEPILLVPCVRHARGGSLVHAASVCNSAPECPPGHRSE